MNALLAFHFKVDPNEWDDEKWARMWAYYSKGLEISKKKNG